MPHPAHGSPGVSGRVFFERVGRTGFSGQAVFYGKCGYTPIGKPLRGLEAFGRENELAVTAASEDHYGCAGGLHGVGGHDRDGGIVDVLHPPVFCFLGFVSAGFRAGGTVAPEREH